MPRLRCAGTAGCNCGAIVMRTPRVVAPMSTPLKVARKTAAAHGSNHPGQVQVQKACVRSRGGRLMSGREPTGQGHAQRLALDLHSEIKATGRPENASESRQCRLPESMGHFGLGNVVVSAAEASALTDIRASIDVIDRTPFEVVD